jgi:hypothetical protein
VGLCKVYAPVNPHTNKIHEELRDNLGKGSEKIRKNKMTKNTLCNGLIDGLLVVL